MAKLIRIWKKFLKSGSAVSAVDADTMAEKRILKMSKRQLREKVKELEKVLSKADQQLNLERKKYKQERIRANQKTAETIALLESEKSGLTSQVERLQETVQAVGKQLTETHKECDKLTDNCKQEREARGSLQVENAKLKETLMQKEESLKDLEDCLAEEKKKHEKTVKTTALLKSEKSGLTSQVERLQEKMHTIGEQLVETQHKCDELTDECQLEREAHGSLQVENVKLKETLMQKEESLKEKLQVSVETIALLESEKSSLTSQVKSLQKSLHSIHKQLADANNKFNVLRDDCELEREAHGSLQEENDKLKDSLAEEKEKHQKTVETITLFKSSLTSQVNTLQETMHSTDKQLANAKDKCDVLREFYEQERQKYSSLQAENDELKEILRQKKEPLKAKRSVPKKPAPASSRLQPYAQAFSKPQTSLPKRKV